MSGPLNWLVAQCQGAELKSCICNTESTQWIVSICLCICMLKIITTREEKARSLNRGRGGVVVKALRGRKKNVGK